MERTVPSAVNTKKGVDRQTRKEENRYRRRAW